MRQGDPLSPYLFIMAMEALNQMLSKSKSGGLISGFKARRKGGGGMFVSHLLFADNTLICCEVNSD